MKTIKFETESAAVTEILTAVITQVPNGANIAEQRRRMRLLDALEEMDASVLTLEDADFSLMKVIYDAFPFRVVHKDILAISSAIDSASGSDG